MQHAAFKKRLRLVCKTAAGPAREMNACSSQDSTGSVYTSVRIKQRERPKAYESKGSTKEGEATHYG